MIAKLVRVVRRKRGAPPPALQLLDTPPGDREVLRLEGRVRSAIDRVMEQNEELRRLTEGG